MSTTNPRTRTRSRLHLRSPMHTRRASTIIPLAVALTLTLLLCTVADAFPSTRIPGEFEFRFGSTDCPRKAKINRQAELIIEAPTQCVKNEIQLTIYDDNEVAGNQLTQELKGGKDANLTDVDKRFGRFTLAQMQSALDCATNVTTRNITIPKGSFINFFVPDETVVLKFVDIFSRPLPKDPNAATASEGDSHGAHGGDGHGGVHKLLAAVRVGTPDESTPTTPTVTNADAVTGTSNNDNNCGPGNVACTTPESSGHSTPKIATKTTTKIGLRDAPQLFRGRAYMSVGAECMYEQTKLAECFPASAKVDVEGLGTIRMDALRSGHNVLIGKQPEHRSPVFMWTHRDAHARSVFLRAETHLGALTVTPGHYVYANDGLVPASDLKRGDFLRTADGQPAAVLSVDYVMDVGLYNPQTVHGDIVVDGFQLSTYTEFAKPPIAHALLAPLRLANILSPAWALDKWRESGFAWA